MPKALNVTEIKRNTQQRPRDCFPAALSCITDFPYEGMPQVTHLSPMDLMFPTLDSEWGKWCREHGVRFTALTYIPTDRYYIGLYVVPALNELHAVVCYNGEIVHNPAKLMLNSSMSKCKYIIVVEEEDHDSRYVVPICS